MASDRGRTPRRGGRAGTPEATNQPPLPEPAELYIGGVAHGGHFVAHHEGRVVFVRHALPGERVTARFTGASQGGRVLFADAVEIHQPAPQRVEAPCPYAGPGRCGGCDFQHIALAEQRRLKAEVICENLARIGGLSPAEVAELGVAVDPVAGDLEGLRWRTRVEFAVGRDQRAGLRRHRSHEVIPLADCLISDPGVVASGVLEQTWKREVAGLDVVSPALGDPVVVPLDRRRRELIEPEQITETVTLAGQAHPMALSARGFWQVHPGAVSTFSAYVLDHLAPRAGERALDLYAGVGPFAAVLADAVGEQGRVIAIESGHEAVGFARANLSPWPWAGVRDAQVEEALTALVAEGERADLVVLDPPRSGAGPEVIAALDRLAPRAIGYIACDPVALARDVRTARELGWSVRALKGFDAFPMTHHVETIAILEK